MLRPGGAWRSWRESRTEDTDRMHPSIRRGLRALLLALPVVLAGCARTSTAPVDENTIEITVHVPAICDARHAERIALHHAAVETIRRGFDDYIVVGTVGGNHAISVGPATARTMPYRDGERTLFSDDAPLLGHHRLLAVRMFRAGEGDGAASVSARAVLGNEWEAIAAKGASNTCFGIGG